MNLYFFVNYILLMTKSFWLQICTQNCVSFPILLTPITLLVAVILFQHFFWHSKVPSNLHTTTAAVEGHLNPGLFNPMSGVEMSFNLLERWHFNPKLFKPWLYNRELFNPMVQKFMVEKSPVEKFMVEKSSVERSRVEAWGEKSRVKMSFNPHSQWLWFTYEWNQTNFVQCAPVFDCQLVPTALLSYSRVWVTYYVWDVGTSLACQEQRPKVI